MMADADGCRRAGTAPRASAPCSEIGAAGLTTIAWAGALFLLAVLTLTATTDVLLAHSQAQTAADASALAAVGASPLVGGDGEAALQARRLANDNGATLIDCACKGLQEAQVVVAVEPRLALVRQALPRLRAHARAELAAR